MARNGSPSAENPVIPEIVRRLVETYHPESVYLFGSAARGDASLDSDYDFMIVMPNDAPVALRRPAKAYECLRGLAVPKDILISTSVDFEKQLHLKASLPATIMREGKLLYGTRPGARRKHPSLAGKR